MCAYRRATFMFLYHSRLDAQGHFVDREPVVKLGSLELLTQFRDGRTTPRVCGHGSFDSRTDIVRNTVLAGIRDGFCGDPEELGDQLLAAPALERCVPGHRSEQCRTESVDVGGRTGWLAGHDLGGGERR